MTLFAETWTKEFMIIDDSFGKMKGSGLYQGTRWQYRWAAPQYLDQMIHFAGSKQILREQLQTFFKEYQYNQGNEPDIHVPFLFNQLGAPTETQSIVMRLLTDQNMIHRFGGNAEFAKPYVGRAFNNAPAGFMPEMDEDDGAMSAWFIFAAMGLYPMKVGEADYEIVSPLFDRITLYLENGRRFTIQTVNRKQLSDPIRAISFNDQVYKGYEIPHALIVQGGMLSLYY